MTSPGIYLWAWALITRMLVVVLHTCQNWTVSQRQQTFPQNCSLTRKHLWQKFHANPYDLDRNPDPGSYRNPNHLQNIMDWSVAQSSRLLKVSCECITFYYNPTDGHTDGRLLYKIIVIKNFCFFELSWIVSVPLKIDMIDGISDYFEPLISRFSTLHHCFGFVAVLHRIDLVLTSYAFLASLTIDLISFLSCL